MNGPIDGLLSTLDLTDTGARTTEDIFTGPSQWMPLGRVFGGQVLAQSIVAAMHTVPADRTIHSMHGYFLRPGDVQHPITFSVDRMHDGRSFSTRRTQAYQNGEPILSLIASFQTHDEGVEHQVDMPTDLPDPESLPSTADVLGEHRPRRRALLVERARVRRAAHPVAHLPQRRGRARAAAGRLDAGRSAGCPTTPTSTARRSPTRATTRSSSRCCARTASPGRPRASRSRASTTRCGGTATRASTSGCSTCRSRRPRAAGAGSRSAASTPATACSWRASPRRAWSACPHDEASD